ncbi:MAG: M1 family metallopeptidase [Candidatus Paceibacterota bacterium]
MQKKKTQNVRLSKYIIPIEYHLELRPDLKNFTFSGSETVLLNILKPTKSLTLHSKEIDIETARIGESFAKINYNIKNETTTFIFPKVLPKGKHKLSLVFQGILNDKMRGFYRSTYTVSDEICHMATTQFEATDARRAFPCFDEPAQKAVFHVSLCVPKGQTAISNTLPVSVQEHEAGFEIVKFYPTPKMSTYLLAFIIGNFEFVESKTKRGIRVRVFTTPGKKHQADFALNCAVKTLEFYEKYFDITYPLPTLDMIAIPDFASGAMENWGAITYRESALLVDDRLSSASNKQWVALVIAHELAHQWFGNLVTMEWWTHLWLNEGFASYIEYLAVDKLFPKWDIWTQFTTNDLGVALRLDALANTHPIEIEVHHPDEIGEIFDEVSYSKGASVIKMLADYLGEKDFRDGLRYYLKKHSYKNTETVHLWQAFEKVSGKPVANMMKNWTGKPGYPVIKVKITNNELSVVQERFFSSPISKTKAKGKIIWQVPILLKNKSITEKHFLNSLSRTIQIKGDKSFVKLNFGESGFFRTAYSKELLDKLRIPVAKKLLSPRDRLGIIRDLFALSEAGTIPTTDALQFLSAYKNEDNYTVWIEITSGLGRLEQILAKTSTKSSLDRYILSIFSPLASRLGWDAKNDESHADSLLRSLAISRAGRSGDKKIILEAKKKFALMQKGGHINPDLRGAIYAIVASSGGMKEYKILVEKYIKESLHEEKNRIGSALGDFNSDRILCLTSHFALSSNVRTQDTVGILSSIGMNPAGRSVWVKCIKQNWPTLVSKYGDGGHTLGRLVKAISASAEPVHLKFFNDFFATHDAPGAKRSIEQVLERLDSNIAWLHRDRRNIAKLLK